MQYAMMFLGAVIGAGFASGREIVSFFSSYGELSWALILLSVFAMSYLCWLCVSRSRNVETCRWCSIYEDGIPFVRTGAEYSVLLLQVLMGGSMLSAAGHVAALCLPLHSAYMLGVLATIAMAMLLGGASLRPMTLLSGLLAAACVMAVLVLLIFDKGEKTALLAPVPDGTGAIGGAFRAIAYAALNLTLAIGAVCRCGGCSCRIQSRSVVLFGFGMAALLLVSNFLYLKHPELRNSTFPMVALLSRFGKAGYILSLLMMYLAILTTLSAGLYALRTGLEQRLPQHAAFALTLLLPIVVSCAGFESIVDRWYAPAGFLCLLLVFMPLLIQGAKIS